MHIVTRNADSAYPVVLDALAGNGYSRNSRNGPVERFRGPTILEYTRPNERVCFWPQRDANPFFHMAEALWMLEGRNDVKSMAWFASNMSNFSDDGLSFHGAYGQRWKFHFGFNQLRAIVKTLRANPEDRRCVLQMWDASIDLSKDGKDFPCNTQATFEIDDTGHMNMSVFNRSNDIVWGALGANVVHFSTLLEYMAAMVGVPVGRYYQISTNLHGYLDTLEKVRPIADHFSPHRQARYDSYSYDALYIDRAPLVEHPVTFDNELGWFWDCFDAYLEGEEPHPFPFSEEGTAPLRALEELDNPYFGRVAIPMVEAYAYYKTHTGLDRYEGAIVLLGKVQDTAWRTAATEWMQRRYEKMERRADSGIAGE